MPKFDKFHPEKTLPSNVLDFVLKHNGITSPEFRGALKKGDAKNILEGIDCIILNAETKTRLPLSESDKFVASLIAQDAVVETLLENSLVQEGSNDKI